MNRFALTTILLTACGSATTAGPAASTPSPAASTNGIATAIGGATTSAETDSKLKATLADPRRPDAERARDKFRHPYETLEFFGLRDDMNVVELWPGGGWYSAILAPVLAEKGHYTVTNFDPNGDPASHDTQNAKAFQSRLQDGPEQFAKAKVQVVHPPTDIKLGPDNSADMVLTFRNLHNWIDNGSRQAILAAAFQVLKPGGTLGVVDHRAAPGANPGESAKKGYLPEAFVISLVESAGFKFAGKSEINANPKDTKDYAEGVWTLPPTLRLKDKDRAKYEAIGESDRMTLKFVKPAR